MGIITIRRLDDDVIQRLKARAKRNGRSMEEEARIAVTRSVGQTHRGQAALDHFRSLREEVFGERILPDSTPLLRELRDADPTAWDGE